MSAHSAKTLARHPAPTTYEREQFEVDLITFEICDHPDHGVTFALIAGRAASAKDRRPLFSGHVSRRMAGDLRRLADRLDALEDKLGEGK